MAFFNDFKELFTSAAQSVSSKTKEGMESARLAGESRSLANALSGVYEQIGRIYTESEGGDTENLGALRRHALELREKIEMLEKQRMQLRNQNRCPACGAAAAKEARFCANCGRRMPEESPEVEPAPEMADVHYCPECGAMMKDGEKFCAMCGFGETDDVREDEQGGNADVFEVQMVRPRPILSRDDGDEAPDDFEAD